MKKRVIVGIIVILSLVVIGVIALNVTNNRAEKQIISLLDEWIEENQLEYSLSYNDVMVYTTQGLLTINGIKVFDSGVKLNIDSLDIEIPFLKALNLYRNPYNSQLTDIKITIKGMNYSDILNSFSIEQPEMKVHFYGNINTKIYNSEYEPIDSDFIINALDIENADIIVKSSIGTMSFEDLSFEAKGNLNPYDFVKENDKANIMTFKDVFEEMSLNLTGFEYTAKQEIRESISMLAYMFLGELSFIGNQENWAIDNLSLQVDVEGEKLLLSNLSLKTNWIDLNSQAYVTINDLSESYTPLYFKLSINDYIDDLRPFFEMIASEITDEVLTEGKFSLSVVMENENSFPEVKLEYLD